MVNAFVYIRRPPPRLTPQPSAGIPSSPSRTGGGAQEGDCGRGRCKGRGGCQRRQRDQGGVRGGAGGGHAHPGGWWGCLWGWAWAWAWVGLHGVVLTKSPSSSASYFAVCTVWSHPSCPGHQKTLSSINCVPHILWLHSTTCRRPRLQRWTPSSPPTSSWYRASKTLPAPSSWWVGARGGLRVQQLIFPWRLSAQRGLHVHPLLFHESRPSVPTEVAWKQYSSHSKGTPCPCSDARSSTTWPALTLPAGHGGRVRAPRREARPCEGPHRLWQDD